MLLTISHNLIGSFTFSSLVVQKIMHCITDGALSLIKLGNSILNKCQLHLLLPPSHTSYGQENNPAGKMKIPPNPLKLFSTLTYNICSIYKNCCYCSSKFIQQRLVYLSTHHVPAINKDIAVNKITPSPHRIYILLAHTLLLWYKKGKIKYQN